MGKSREYKCPKCGYKAISSGGKDMGMVVEVETHICNDCGILTDVITEWHLHDDPEIQDEETDLKVYECKKCGGKNIVVWDTVKKPCPKCGTTLINEGGIEILWD